MKPTNNRLSTDDTLNLVQQFTEKIGSYASREGRIDYAEKLAASNSRASEAEQVGQIEAQTAEKKAGVQEWLTQAKTALEAKAIARAEQIEKAKLAVRQQLMEGIKTAEGHQRYDLQRQMMDSAKRRDQQIEAARQELEAAKAEIGANAGKLEEIEQAAPKAFRAFSGPQKKLLAAIEGKGGPKEIKYNGSVDDAYKRTAKVWKAAKGNPMLGLYAVVPIWLQAIVAVLIGGAAYFLRDSIGLGAVEPTYLLMGAGGLVLLVIVVWAMVAAAAGSSAAKLSKCFLLARHARQRLFGPLEELFEAKKAAYEAEHQQVETAFNEGIKSTGEAAGSSRMQAPEQVDQKAQRIANRLGQWKANQLAQIEQTGAAQLAQIDAEHTDALAARGPGDALADFAAQRATMVTDWQGDSAEQLEQMQGVTASFDLAGHWSQRQPGDWAAPTTFPEEVVYGTLDYKFHDTEARIANHDEIDLGHSGEFALPLRLLFPSQGSILIETGAADSRETAIDTLNQIVGSLLTNAPAGRVSFSLVDPVSLGESFAGLMHLSDYEEHLVNKRVRTQADQIEARLGELCEHMEKVIQMYLRNEYETISEYNQAAGTTAERYHFLVVSDFPNNFTDEALRRLQSIAKSGARCGVFTLIHYDRRVKLPSGFMLDDLKSTSVWLKSAPEGFLLGDEPIPGTQVALLPPPPADRFLEWVHRIGEENRDSNRIMVPFDKIAPTDEQFWAQNTSGELRVPIGPTGATKLQELAIGKGTCQHALIAGKTGSGKSTLFHVMITNMALWCDPDQVEFYLIDFKKGVEFKAYATHKLPHARVIAIESDREFGLSVLQKLDEELKDRGEKFRAIGAQDVAGYFKAGGTDPVPRTLLLIDEFQEFFVEDDQISQQAAVLLDRIVRQGRAFGIHAVLGSQTLGGAFTLARATLGQMVVRIALMCNEADAYLIMDDSNPAPRLLTRPGEGIYNDQAGNAEANSPFQVVWLDDDDRNKYLSKVATAAAERGLDGKPRVVFEGNAPAEITEDRYIADLLQSGDYGGSPRLFLGAPNSIKTPTEAVFERQSGANLMIVGQRDDVVEGMLTIGLRMLIEQLGEKGRFILIDGQLADPNGQSWLKEAVPLLGDRVTCPEAHEMGDVITSLAQEMKAKADGTFEGEDTTTFLIILGLQKYKKLRYEEDFSFSLDEDAEAKPSDALNDLITEGPGLGFHNILSIDTYNNVGRCISRKAVSEFEKKILFQMSAADSASLIDTGKAGNLGMNRAIYYNEPTGIAETFRPYAQPPREWLG